MASQFCIEFAGKRATLSSRVLPLRKVFTSVCGKTVEELRIQIADSRDHLADYGSGFEGRVAGAHQQVQPSATPAFPGATTASFATGLPKGSKQTFTFEASKAGTYEFVCGVQGHAVAGAWDAFVVSATADAPSVTPPGAATISVK